MTTDAEHREEMHRIALEYLEEQTWSEKPIWVLKALGSMRLLANSLEMPDGPLEGPGQDETFHAIMLCLRLSRAHPEWWAALVLGREARSRGRGANLSIAAVADAIVEFCPVEAAP